MGDADESGARPCRHWPYIFEAREDGAQDHSCDTILNFVQRAPDHVQWTLCRREFDEMLATKKSAPGPDGVPYSVYRSAGGIGANILCTAFEQLLDDGELPVLLAASRTVFIPLSTSVDNYSRNVRSPES